MINTLYEEVKQVIRFDETSRILWIEANTSDQAWELFHANPIPIPDSVRAIAHHNPSNNDIPTGMIVRKESIEEFFDSTKRISVPRPRIKDRIIHILPYAAVSGKFQFLLETPLKLWEFKIPVGESPENGAVRHCYENIVQSGLTEDDTLIGITNNEDELGVHFYFLLSIGEECKSDTPTIWVEREKFDDWKWDDRVKTITGNSDVIAITRRANRYTQIVEKMMA